MKKKLTILAALALVAGLMLPAGMAWGLACGDIIATDTTLDSSLTCSGPGLIIGADGITLDLDGYTLSGDGTIPGVGVDNTGGYDDVTIEDGAIVGFEQGIRAEGGTDLTLKDLSFSGDTGGGHAHVIDIRDYGNVVIKDVTIVVGAGSPDWAEAMRLESINDVEVENVDVDGGWIGVNFACDDCDGSELPTNGVVKDSTFEDNGLFGVFIANSTDATIEGNEIIDTGLFGIYVGSEISTGLTGITVKGNEVSGIGIFHGIVLNIVDSSYVLQNHVSGSGTDGIALYGGSSYNQVSENEVSGSGRYGISLRGGASNNLVKENEVSVSGTADLHDVGTDNTWEENE
jgi:parallel beta-helix repeat protein